MKKIILALLIVSGFMLQKADAQVRFGVHINIGAQPDWGPRGYDYAQYYYFPDIYVYYDVVGHQFVYFDGNDWEFSPYLPQAYGNFDLYRSYKVVINEPRPYLRDDYYRRQYYNYRGYRGQEVIRDRREDRFERRDEHFDHDRFEGHDNGWHRGWDRDDHRRRDRD